MDIQSQKYVTETAITIIPSQLCIVTFDFNRKFLTLNMIKFQSNTDRRIFRYRFGRAVYLDGDMLLRGTFSSIFTQ